MLQPTDRHRNLLSPSAANSPPRLSITSSSSETTIEWGEATLHTPIHNTPVYYVLQYNLSFSSEVQQNATVSFQVYPDIT